MSEFSLEISGTLIRLGVKPWNLGDVYKRAVITATIPTARGAREGRLNAAMYRHLEAFRMSSLADCPA